MYKLVFLLLIGLVIAGFVLEQLLSFLNNRSRAKDIPPSMKDIYPGDKYLKYRSYRQESYRFGVLSSWFSFLLIVIMISFGFAELDEWVSTLSDSALLQSLLFFAVLGLASDLLSTPFDVYDTFVIEQKWGFNRITPRLYISDKLKSWLLGAILGGGMLSLVIWLYTLAGTSFWWMAWVVISLFSVLFTLFYSSLIVPLFNRQTPLEEGELRSKLNELAFNTGFSVSNIYVIDGSKRSSRSNAYFSGFGSRKRIVLYDTLIQNHTADEIMAVVAHEIGHYRKRHILKGLIFSVLQTGLILFLFSLIIDNQLIYKALGSERMSFHLGLIVFFVLYSPVSAIISLGGNYISRQHEFEADYFAKSFTSGASLAKALRKLASENMADLTPHPLYVLFHYSHPPLADRLKRLE
ncbi:Protease HtpX [bioreactor metagenome]|jgi:STE24 endopeptidase|uniref:Protease HtpX n=1 Tax=bioreactor metagenome TaxID=1076179 RepID=A0A644TYT8_9ZZZZ|nr:M48 family metallopeptidase [Lentimicrobium sp.]MEA5110909.1 M48 family metallopeptidase [Lentimicrobium sp.]